MVSDVFPALSWLLMCSRHFHGTLRVPGTFITPDVFLALLWHLIVPTTFMASDVFLALSWPDHPLVILWSPPGHTLVTP